MQAEDSIRDRVRSRGLGDVYKRQIYSSMNDYYIFGGNYQINKPRFNRVGNVDVGVAAVSYTHIPLPKSDQV